MNRLDKPPRTWREKFRDAFRGVVLGIRGQTSFVVHLTAAVLVVFAAAGLRVSAGDWCLLLLCTAAVFTAELFNSAIERLARAVDHQHNEQIRDALDIASGAVLVAAIGAVLVGLTVFVPYLLG